MELTPDHKLFIHDCLVDRPMLGHLDYRETCALRNDLLEWGYLSDNNGWIEVTNKGLRYLDNFTARRVLRARGEDA